MLSVRVGLSPAAELSWPTRWKRVDTSHISKGACRVTPLCENTAVGVLCVVSITLTLIIIASCSPSPHPSIVYRPRVLSPLALSILRATSTAELTAQPRSSCCTCPPVHPSAQHHVPLAQLAATTNRPHQAAPRPTPCVGVASRMGWPTRWGVCGWCACVCVGRVVHASA